MEHDRNRGSKRGKLLLVATLLVQISGCAAPNPFAIALRDNNQTEVRRLMNEGADVNGELLSDGSRPLHFAAVGRYPELAIFLIDNGADVNGANHQGATALHAAALLGHERIVYILIAKSADPSISAGGITAADAARQGKHWDLGSLIESPLHLVAKFGDESAIRVFLARGADINAPLRVNAPTGERRTLGKLEPATTPLDLAVAAGESGAAILLLSQGARSSTSPEAGISTVHRAAAKGLTKLLQWMHQHGYDFNSVTRSGWTVLHSAASSGNLETVELVYEETADPNAKNSRGDTPLQVAIDQEHLEVARWLVDKGALDRNSWGKDVAFSKLGMRPRCQTVISKLTNQSYEEKGGCNELASQQLRAQHEQNIRKAKSQGPEYALVETF